MQRSKVDLPEPDAPMRQTTSCSATESSIPRRTSALPNRLCSPATSRAAAGALSAGSAHRRPSIAGEQPIGESSERDGHHDEHQGDRDIGREVEARGLLDLGGAKDLHDPDEGDQHGVLLEPDEIVEQGRDHPANGLRHDHVAKRLEPAQTQGTGGRLLARMDGFDSRSIDLGDVGAVDQGQGQDPVQPLVRSWIHQTEARDAEAHDVDHEHARQRSKDVRVRGR